MLGHKQVHRAPPPDSPPVLAGRRRRNSAPDVPELSGDPTHSPSTPETATRIAPPEWFFDFSVLSKIGTNYAESPGACECCSRNEGWKRKALSAGCHLQRCGRASALILA